MVITNDFKNRVRDLIIADIGNGAHGTDGTTPTITDVDLGAKVVGSEKAVEKDIGNKMINITHKLLPTEANGETLKEFAMYCDSNGTMVNRVVYPDFEKNSTIELQTITTMRIN